MAIIRHLASRYLYRHDAFKPGALAILLALTLTSACSADQERNLPDDRLWESTHFRYHTREGDDGACKAVLEQLERHFALMQAYLGFPWPQSRKVDYYKFLDTVDYHSNSECSEDSGGCVKDASVRSPYTLDEHELIHAYLAPLGLLPEFFSEGVATALACTRPEMAPIEPKPWQDVVAVSHQGTSYSLESYIYGGWFVGALLHRHGADRFLLLFDGRDNHAASREQISSAFESAYGETLDSAWNASLASSYRSRCVNLWKCSGPSLPLDGTPQSLMNACDGGDHTRTFQVNAETDVLMSIEGPFIYAPTSCDEDLPYAVGGDEFGAITDSSVAPLSTGKYFIQAMGQNRATFGIRALPARALSKDCAEIEPINLQAVDYPRWTFKLTIPNDGPAWFVKLNRQIIWPEQIRRSVEQCFSCGASPVCQPIGTTGDTVPDADGNVTLRLTPTNPGPGYVTSRFLF